jgi:hypothetical protein
MFSKFITKTYKSAIRYTTKKNKELLSVGNNSLKHIPPKYSQNKKVTAYYSKPFDLQNFSMNQKRNYFANPQKPPEDEFYLYIIICCTFLTYRYIDKSPPPNAF